MESTKHPSSLSPQGLRKVEARIQERVDAGYTSPCGWLFRGLTFFFFTSSSRETETEEEEVAEIASTEITRNQYQLARNTAQFAGAAIASSLRDKNITHIVVDPTTLSDTEISSLRASIAAKVGAARKIPHLVVTRWVEECWSHGTLLDEES